MLCDRLRQNQGRLWHSQQDLRNGSAETQTQQAAYAIRAAGSNAKTI